MHSVFLVKSGVTGGSKRRVFSESDEKPWFKEAFNEIELVTSSLLGTSTKGLILSL
jgi:hypothetical protein